MAASPMDPLYEQRLRDEVVYLHSLWRQGPPRAAASTSARRHHHHLQPSQATQFKKEKKQKGKKSTNKPSNTATESHSSPGLEWAVPSPPPPPPTDGWPSLEAKPGLQPQTLSPEAQSKLAAKHAHQHALKVVTEFFRYNNAGDVSDSIDSSGDEDDGLMDEDDGREEYSFFFKVFNEDNELREYYEKNFVKGEFSCLVCGALGGKKMGKKYKGCFPLVQHSIAIAKTKKRKAHRAFGQAICKVLGWDINQLSSIVSLLSDNSGETPENGRGDKESSMTIVDNVVSMEGDIVEGKIDKAVPESGSIAIVENVVSIEGDIVEGKNDETVPESGSIGTGILPNGDEGDMNSLTCTDTDKSLEDVGMVHNMEEPAAEGLTNNSLTCPDADQNLENIGMVLPHHLEKPPSEGLTISCLTGPDADQNLENIGMVLPHHLEEPTSEGLTSVPFNENNGAGIEDNEIEN